MCDCEEGRFDCEGLVRRFLRAESGSSAGQAALAELLEKHRPLIQRIVNRRLWAPQWRQSRQDVFQEVMLKLCNPEKLATWLLNPRRSRFCHWVAVVTARVVIDFLRKQLCPREEVAHDEHDPQTTAETAELATRLRQKLIAALAEFDLGWRLVFYMRFSYLEPSIPTIARAAGIAGETVHFRIGQMKRRLAKRCAKLLGVELSKLTPVGAHHPVKAFDRLEKPEQRQLNQRINELVQAWPLKERLAFYMKYSPLAVSPQEIARQLGESHETIAQQLERIEAEIRELRGTGAD